MSKRAKWISIGLVGTLVALGASTYRSKREVRTVPNAKYQMGAARAPILQGSRVILPTVAPPEIPPHLRVLDKEIQDLKDEITRGEYVQRINDETTPHYIKAEMRQKVRLYAEKTLELVRSADL